MIGLMARRAQILVDSFAHLIDVGGKIERQRLPRQDDAEAVWRDWQQVGDDLRDAMAVSEPEVRQAELSAGSQIVKEP